MSTRHPSSKHRCSRPLSSEEQRLLEALKKTIIPLKTPHIALPFLETFFRADLPETQSLSFSSLKTSAPFSPLLKKPLSILPSTIPSIEKHTARKIKSRRSSFSAILDLHGLTQKSAYEKLTAFILKNSEVDQRSLLIITGKGQGILKASLLRWLQEDPLRSFIAALEQALPLHGGEGAFYVILRKKQKISP